MTNTGGRENYDWNSNNRRVSSISTHKVWNSSGTLNKWDNLQSRIAQKLRSDSSHQGKNLGTWCADWRATEKRINSDGRQSYGLTNLAEGGVKATIPVVSSCCVMYLFIFYLISFFFLFPPTFHWKHCSEHPDKIMTKLKWITTPWSRTSSWLQ